MAGNVVTGSDANLSPATLHHARAKRATHLNRLLLPNTRRLKDGMNPFPTSWQGFALRYIDDDRTGRARTDWCSRGHILNPYYWRDGFPMCACRTCEPHMWVRWPLPYWLDDEASEAVRQAESKFAGVRLDAEFERLTA